MEVQMSEKEKFKCPEIPYPKPTGMEDFCELIDCWAAEWREWGKNVQKDLIDLSTRIEETRAACTDISGGGGPGTGTGPPPDPPFGGGPT